MDRTSPRARQSTTRVVIFNVDTVALTALAALSAIRHLPFETVIVDCSANRHETGLCMKLCRELGIRFERMPSKAGGNALDRLYATTRSHVLVHLDSDAEILDGRHFLDAYEAFVDEEDCYGLGWLQNGSAAATYRRSFAWHSERPWMPFCAFKTSHIKQALEDEVSFEASLERRAFRFWPRTFKKTLFPGQSLPRLTNPALSREGTRKQRFDLPYAYNDTGALIHRRMAALGYSLKTLDWERQAASVTHFQDVTRNRLSLRMPGSAHHLKAAADAVKQISSKYRKELPAPMFRRIVAAAGLQSI